MRTISSGAVSLRTPITVNRAVLPVCSSTISSASGGSRLPRLDACEPESGGTAEPSCRAAARRAVDHREPGPVRERCPHLRSVRSPRDRPRPNVVCARKPSSSPRRGTSRRPPAPTCLPRRRGRTGSRRPRIPPDRRRAYGSARRHVPDQVGPVGARANMEPAPELVASMAWTNDPFDAVPVTSVNTTSVNIASVIPVRNRARAGTRSTSGAPAPDSRTARTSLLTARAARRR